MKQNEMTALPAAEPARTSRFMPADMEPAQAAPVENVRTGAAKPPDGAANGPDLLIPASESVPLPQGAAREPALDVLYESAEEHPAAETDKIGAGYGRAKRGVRALAHLFKRQIQEHVPEPDVPALEATHTAGLLIGSDAAARPGGGPRGKSGKRPKNKAGGASAERPAAAWSDSDIPVESGERLHRVAVVAHTHIQEPSPPKMNRSSTLPALRPKSRVECERRCGSDGFCDPSDPLGCGGLHCGQQHDMLY